jgi:hypothetical protein
MHIPAVLTANTNVMFTTGRTTALASISELLLLNGVSFDDTVDSYRPSQL